MRRFVIFLLFMLCFLSIEAQQISLVVDNQNPGWLSNKIGYGDQKSVQNLKVTGYINSTDLSFIGELIGKQSLNGILDLEDAYIVGDTDNIIDKAYFGYGELKHLLLPKSLVSAKQCINALTLDTLTVGGEAMPTIECSYLYADGELLNKRVRNLKLRAGIVEIPNRTFYRKSSSNKEECIFTSITLPHTITKIGDKAFTNNFALGKVNLPEGIEEIGDQAFYNTAYNPDTLKLPKNLRRYHTRAFNNAKVIYFDSAIEEINNVYSTYNNSFNTYYYHDYLRLQSNNEIHLKATTPPKFYCYSNTCLKGCTIYVPKSSLSIYKNDSFWKCTTILAEPNPAKSIELNYDRLDLRVNSKIVLTAEVFPADADTKEVTWSSSNSDIAYVDGNGEVTGIKSGKSYIYATLGSNTSISDSCLINVHQPVTAIKLSSSSILLNVGETYDLDVSFTPNDADNKKVIWHSDNNKTAVVDNGKVSAINTGSAKIYAISEEDSMIYDYCEVTIVQLVSGISLSYDSYKFSRIGETIQLEAVVYPENASNKNVNWKSSN